MGKVNFRYNATTYSLHNNWYEQYDYPTLVSDYAILRTNTYSGSGQEHSAQDAIPALPTKGSRVYFGEGGFGRMYLDTSSPTIAFRKNGKTYYCAKDLLRIHRYQVSYSSNGGAGSMSSQQFYPDDGEAVTISSNSFIKTGYSFSSWNTDSSNSGAAYSPGSKYNKKENIILYAIWKAVSYSIAYNLNGGTNSKSNPSTYTIEDAVTFAAPTRNGYTFSKWTPASIAKGTTGAVTTTASWSPVAYGITYSYDYPNRVSANPSKTSYTIEEAVTPANPAMKAGYSFRGWSPSSIAKGSTGAKTFTGSTSIDTYKISYDLNDGVLSSNPNPTSYNVETDTITFSGAPTYSARYYKFLRWIPSSIPKGSTGDKTVYANKDYIGPLIDSLTYTTSRSQLSSTKSDYTYTAKYKTTVNTNATVIGQGDASIWADACYFNGRITDLGGWGRACYFNNSGPEGIAQITDSCTVSEAENGSITYTFHVQDGSNYLSSKSDTDKKSIAIPINNVETITADYSYPIIDSFTVGSISYGSWSSWSGWTKTYIANGRQYYSRSRSRKWSTTATVLILYTGAVGLSKITVSYQGSTFGSASYKEVLIGATTKTISVSGSGGDFSYLTATAYNRSDKADSNGTKNVNVSIDASDYDSKSEAVS